MPAPDEPPLDEEKIFQIAAALPAAERDAFLRSACAGHPQIRAEVERLLASIDDGAFMQKPVDRTVSPELEAEFARLKPEEAGDRIGPYKLLQEIGMGGFGTVWMAEQEKPVRRRVALKIIKMGMDTKEVIARFEQERQALAMMDHPNIARVFDAGATQYGRPFFVMELVRGVKITDYCDEQGLSTVERIELFIHVCQAVQHAHQKGIIHRDLKPSNILVTINDGEPVPKVIDFGVAKATQGGLTDGTLFTKFEQMIGTPLYMSPEQAEMTSLDVDTRSDIYALGVLLYELLTGRTPIDTATMARAGMDEIRRLIREVDPPRPSQRLKTLAGNELTTMAKRRHTEAAKLPGALRGDLDWIVMKCLEKDRKRRYDTANGLASDLQRHLKNEVVIARPPTTGYLLSKLIKRNKSAVVAGCTVVLALIVGFAVAVWQAKRAQNEATRAKTAEQHSAAALDELRASAPAFAEQARGLAAREQFDDAITKLDYAIKLRPDAAEYLVAKGDLLQCQRMLAEAAAIYREALRVKPGLARAEASAKLCDELLAAPLSEQGKLTRESLAKLHLAMQKQQRPAAELMPVARLLGEEKKLLVEYWLARLKDLPISAERPLKDRLTVRDDGRLALDLSDAKVNDLSSLAGAPLAVLNVSNSKEQSELTDLSPLRGLALLELNISETNVADLTPLREMHTLEKLDLSGSRVTDLTPLSALRIRSLALRRCAIRDLTPLRKMPLEEINLRQSRVTDLSPLIGMPIKSIDLSFAPVLDFTPLAQLPLEKCYLENSKITDLSVLRGRPLKELVLSGCGAARHYAVLSEIKTLELLLLDGWYRNLPDEDYEAIGRLRDHPSLRQLAAAVFNARTRFGSDGNVSTEMSYAATASKDIFWQDWDRDQAFVPALRKSGIKFDLHKHASGADHLHITNQPLHDLSVLKGARVGILTLWGCPFTDLTPIRDLPVETLELTKDPATDLSPLRGMPLKTLNLNGAGFSDLSPLAGMPLNALYVDGCPNVTDVAVLAQIPILEQLAVPILARGIPELRKLNKLQRLAFASTGINVELIWPATTVAEFWKEYEANPWIARLRESGVKPKVLKRLDDGTWEVNLEGSGITDLTILSGAPISSLWLGFCAVSDLAPLRGMPLKTLFIWFTKVRDLTPLKGMPLDSLNVAGTKVTDLSPLRGMPLTNLNLRACPDLTELSPLADCRALKWLNLPPNARNLELFRTFPNLERISYTEDAGSPTRTAAEFWQEYEANPWIARLRESGIKIRELQRLDDGTWFVNFEGSAITDLTVLSGAPISILWLGGIAVSDLAPLRGMPLKALSIWGTNVTDLTPLKGMPLDSLLVFETKVTDLSPLRGMQLTNLRLNACPDLTDLSPLADCRALKWLTLPPNAKNLEIVRTFPKLERVSFNEDHNNGIRPDKTAAEFWQEYDAPWIARLRESGIKMNVLKRLDDGTWEVNLQGSAFSDLTILSGAPISRLFVGGTAVSDLTPLRGMPLKLLHIWGTKVTDLTPLKGMPIDDLHISGTKVTDLSVLRGMPLTLLRFDDCEERTDLSPLADCKELTRITIPLNAENIGILRTLPKLERISFKLEPNPPHFPDKTAAEFWQEYDAKKK